MQVKNAKKQPDKLSLSPKPSKILRQDPITYISETGKVTECVRCFGEKQCVLCTCRWCSNVPPVHLIKFIRGRL